MTYLYSLIGEYVYTVVFPFEFICTALHILSKLDMLPMGRKYKESLVRVTFGIELLCLHYCFWHLNYSMSFYGAAYYYMMGHYIFHCISNPFSIFIQLDDYSQHFEAPKEKAKHFVLRLDTPGHIYNVFCLSMVLGLYKTVGLTILTLAFLKVFPKEWIYEK